MRFVTSGGRDLALQAAETISKASPFLSESAPPTIYTSPLLGAVATAVTLSDYWGGMVKVVAGLGDNGNAGAGSDLVLSDDELRLRFPQTNFRERDEESETFDSACAWLANLQRDVICVSDSECIRMLGGCVATPPCCIASFSADTQAAHYFSIRDAFHLNQLLSSQGDDVRWASDAKVGAKSGAKAHGKSQPVESQIPPCHGLHLEANPKLTLQCPGSLAKLRTSLLPAIFQWLSPWDLMSAESCCRDVRTLMRGDLGEVTWRGVWGGCCSQGRGRCRAWLGFDVSSVSLEQAQTKARAKKSSRERFLHLARHAHEMRMTAWRRKEQNLRLRNGFPFYQAPLMALLGAAFSVQCGGVQTEVLPRISAHAGGGSQRSSRQNDASGKILRERRRPQLGAVRRPPLASQEGFKCRSFRLSTSISMDDKRRTEGWCPSDDSEVWKLTTRVGIFRKDFVLSFQPVWRGVGYSSDGHAALLELETACRGASALKCVWTHARCAEGEQLVFASIAVSHNSLLLSFVPPKHSRVCCHEHQVAVCLRTLESVIWEDCVLYVDKCCPEELKAAVFQPINGYGLHAAEDPAKIMLGPPLLTFRSEFVDGAFEGVLLLDLTVDGTDVCIAAKALCFREMGGKDPSVHGNPIYEARAEVIRGGGSVWVRLGYSGGETKFPFRQARGWYVDSVLMDSSILRAAVIEPGVL
jgi:hypothetical protein